MTATLRKDGTIDFHRSSGLLSIESITRQAARLFVESHKRVMETEKAWRTQETVNALRKSCGIEPERTTIRFSIGIRLPETTK